ncbi:hypothetical protein G9A89_012134 [Geosiphon pyriformis]|nr:hypothetical protein G9A89_012134 [Geosiphon pyriformis]
MADTAAFFEDIDLGLSVRVYGLVSSTIVELQTIALALEFKGHSGASDNKCVDAFVRTAAFSNRCLLHMVSEHFLKADNMTDSKVAAQNIVSFVCEFCFAFWDDIWLVYVKH